MKNKENFLDVMFIIATSLVIAALCYLLTSFILWELDPSKWDKKFRFFNVLLICLYSLALFIEIGKNKNLDN